MFRIYNTIIHVTELAQPNPIQEYTMASRHYVPYRVLLSAANWSSLNEHNIATKGSINNIQLVDSNTHSDLINILYLNAYYIHEPITSKSRSQIMPRSSSHCIT